jgi:hypothetical protein
MVLGDRLEEILGQDRIRFASPLRRRGGVGARRSGTEPPISSRNLFAVDQIIFKP